MADKPQSTSQSENIRADISQRRGQEAAKLPPEKRAEYIKRQGDYEADHMKSSGGNMPRIDNEVLDRDPAMASYKKGTDNVPKTGPAILHKGEAVLTKKENEERHGKKKKLHLHKIITTRAKDGSFGHEHIYKEHPDDEQEKKGVFAGTSQDMEDLHQHMDDHFGGGAEEAGGGEPEPEAAGGEPGAEAGAPAE